MIGRIVGVTMLGLCLGHGLTQTSQEANPGPVQAELVTNLNVRRLAQGDTVFAKLTRDWNGLGCTLRTGAILEARVETADRRQGRGESKLALSFARAQCNGMDLQPMKLLLAAVAQAPPDWRVSPNKEFRVPMSSLLANGKAGAGFGDSTIGNFSMPTLELTGILHQFPMSPSVKPGDVINIRGMKLDIGTGPNQSSVLTTRNRDLSLDAFTQFLLVPSSLVSGPGAASLVSESPSPDVNPTAPLPASPSPPAPVNNINVCAPPGCVVDLPVTAKELVNRDTASILTPPLGYTPRPQKILGDFGDDETLSWLGSRQLLLAFNRHPLIHRSGDSLSGVPRRVIRAVLLDAQTHSVVRAVDWEITDTRRYLWPVGNNRILVHVGNELRVYREGLELVHSIPLGGPLAFVRIAPNGELLAIATLRERHSVELHAKLREEVGEEPEEDVEVALLDKDFSIIAQTSATSRLQPPTLLNEGQVKLYSQPNMQFRVALKTWDNKNISLARFASRCTPELFSVAPDLLFLLSCDVATDATTYRVLGADGKLLLSGEAGPRDIGHGAAGNHDAARFAIGVVHAIRELSPGIEFRTSELESQEVRVYRAGDGKRLLAVRINDPVASHDTYALSPDGDQLAILSESQIKFFSVPAE